MILLVLKAGESYIGNEEEMKQKGKKIWTPYAMVFPAFAVMMLVVVLPIINTIMQSSKQQMEHLQWQIINIFLRAKKRFRV